MVVLVAAVCVVHAQERIKMCGRELIRLAVSSCGNSRLRRSIPDVELGQDQYTSHCEYFVEVIFLNVQCVVNRTPYNLFLPFGVSQDASSKFPGFSLNPGCLSTSSAQGTRTPPQRSTRPQRRWSTSPQSLTRRGMPSRWLLTGSPCPLGLDEVLRRYLTFAVRKDAA